MKNVLYFQWPWRMWLDRATGIYRYAGAHGWNVDAVKGGHPIPDIPRSLSFWRPDGCIVEGGYTEQPRFNSSVFGKTPVVYCDANRKRMKGPYSGIEHDPVKTAITGANELLRQNLSSYAYVGHILRREWSDFRRDALVFAVAGMHVFSPHHVKSVEDFFVRIAPWLAELPKPCGLLAANDEIASLVLRACRLGHIGVPDEIAVVGIDDDRLVCENTVPTLTSVVTDFERSGYLAAELLAERIEEPRAQHRLVRFGADGIVCRGSTVKFARRDDAVRDALEFIRKESCCGISASDVLKRMPGSRRQCEIRFRDKVGYSIGEKISEVRISRAKEMLLKKYVSVDSISSACGFNDPSSFRRVFKKSVGLSPREWRSAQNAR